jgi:hypothetical protein
MAYQLEQILKSKKTVATKSIVSIIASAALITLFSGCESGDSNDDNSNTTTKETPYNDKGDSPSTDPVSTTFAITYPASGSTIASGRNVTISGSGAQNAAAFDVYVITDKPWYQGGIGSLKVSGNGNWKFNGVELGGTGVYNNHTIEATIIRNDGTTAKSSVSGVVRTNPY